MLERLGRGCQRLHHVVSSRLQCNVPRRQSHLSPRQNLHRVAHLRFTPTRTACDFLYAPSNLPSRASFSTKALHATAIATGGNVSRVQSPLLSSQSSVPEELLDNIDKIPPHRLSKDAILRYLGGPSSINARQFSDREQARDLAILIAKSSRPQMARRVLSLAHRLGYQLPQSTYESVTHCLAQRGLWNLIPPVVNLGKRHTGRTTVRLLNWRARALVENKRYRLLEDVLPEFEREKLEPGRRTYHLVATGHLRNSNVEKAKECLRWMEDSGFPVDASTHALVVATYRTLGPDDAVQARSFEVLKGIGQRTATMILNSLMQLYIDARDMMGTMRVLALFDRSKIDTGRSQRPTSNTQPRPGTPRDAWPPSTNVEGDVPPDAATFTMLINCMARECDVPRALRVFSRMQAAGFRPDTKTAAALLRAYLATGHIASAIHFIASMCSCDVDTLASLRALAPQPPTDTATVPQIAGLELTTELLNVLLDGLAKTHGMRAFTAVFKIMRAHQLSPDETTEHILLSYLAKMENVRPREIIGVLRKISSQTLRPTSQHLHTVLRSIQKREKMTVYGRGWDVVAARFSKKRRDVARYDPAALAGVSGSLDPFASIQAPNKYGHRKQLTPVTQSLSDRGVRGDRAMFAIAMQQRAVIQGSPDSAAQLFNVMLSRGIHPTAHHYAALMDGYARKGNMTAAVTTLDAAHQAGIKPNVVLYTILIAGYARQGKPDLAMRVFQEMVSDGIRPDVGAIDAVSSAYFVVGSYAMARTTLVELWPQVSPFPEELRTASLKTLARRFRSLGKEPTQPPVVDGDMTARELRVLGWRLERLLTRWKRAEQHSLTRTFRGTTDTSVLRSG